MAFCGTFARFGRNVFSVGILIGYVVGHLDITHCPRRLRIGENH
jgi:hypothetical protein